MLSKDEVRYIADLSRIHLKEQEIEYFTKNLTDILGYIDKLKPLDVETVQPTSHVLALQNVFREDVAQKSQPQEDILKIAVAQENGCFKVPQVIE